MDRPWESISRLFNRAYHAVDAQLASRCLSSGGIIHAGSTAVTAFIRYEDDERQQSFLPSDHPLAPRAPSSSTGRVKKGKGKRSSRMAPYPKEKPVNSKEKSSDPLSAVTSSLTVDADDLTTFSTPPFTPVKPPPGAKRVLYTANAGDARAVLCRGGRALRLTYDHRGDDRLEARRIQDLGGFTMSGRVHGALAVTRSLGDPGLKEFVICAPFTSRVPLTDEDEFLILACDGVCNFVSFLFIYLKLTCSYAISLRRFGT
jgi:protein phosphatase PTC1